MAPRGVGERIFTDVDGSGRRLRSPGREGISSSDRRSRYPPRSVSIREIGSPSLLTEQSGAGVGELLVAAVVAAEVDQLCGLVEVRGGSAAFPRVGQRVAYLVPAEAE
jgi:hypothetical protein